MFILELLGNFIAFLFSMEDHDDLMEFFYVVKIPLQVLKGQNAEHRKYKYHVESPLTHRHVISSLEFIAGIDAKKSLIDRCLKLHLPLDLIQSKCKFIKLILFICSIKTHGSVSVAKKAELRTSVLFTGTPVSTFSAYCSSKTIGAISAKFIYVV